MCVHMYFANISGQTVPCFVFKQSVSEVEFEPVPLYKDQNHFLCLKLSENSDTALLKMSSRKDFL